MRLSLVLALAFLTTTGTYAAEKAAKDVKVKIGVITIESYGKNADLAVKATDELLLVISDFGFYNIFTQQDIETSLGKIHRKMPRRCRDPRCVIDIGSALGLDRMVVGSVDENGTKIGVSLQLIDVYMQQTIEEVKLEGQPGVGVGDVVRAAAMRLHGTSGDTSASSYSTYFGPQVHNEKQFIISTASFLGAGLLWGLVNYGYERSSTPVAAEYGDFDEPLSGIPSSADQIPMFARPAALANAYVAESDDACGVLYNPAGMAWVSGPEAVAAYQLRFGLDNFAASFANKATREIGFGQAVLYSGDREGLMSEMYFVSAVAYKIHQLTPLLRPMSVGINAKVVSNTVKATSEMSVGGSSFGAGFDIGLLWELSEKIRYGAVLRDAPVVNRWKNVSTGRKYFEANAATLHMGGTFQSGYTTFLICEGQIPLHQDQVFKMAGALEQEIFRLFVFRVGLQKEILTSFDAPWHVTGGFGLRVDKFSVDGSYEYNTLRVFDVVNVSLGLGF